MGERGADKHKVCRSQKNGRSMTENVKTGNGFDVQSMRAEAVFFRLIGVLTFWLIEEGLELAVAPVSDRVAVEGFV